MKRLIYESLALSVLCLVSSELVAPRGALAARLYGQSPSPAEQSPDVVSVNIYKAYKTDGEKAKAGDAIDPSKNNTFHSGDYILVDISPNFLCYIYFISRSQEGTRVIYPKRLEDIFPIKPDREIPLPFHFEGPPGHEDLIVVVSHDHLPKLDAAIGPDKTLDLKSTPLVEGGGKDSGPGLSKGEAAPESVPEKDKDKTGPGRTTPKKKPKSLQNSGMLGQASWDEVPGSARRIEFDQEEGDKTIRVRLSPDASGNYRYGTGDVGAFTISFEHQ
jgi:hypothetical protein